MADNLSSSYTKYLHLINQLKLFDDDFMTLALRDKNCVELILTLILQRSIHIDNVYTQDVMKNLIGRSGILDIVAIDTSGILYNLDVQNNSEGAHPKRLRYHGSIMDIHFTDVNMSWKDIPQRYVIFITQKDVMKKGLPIYHIRQRIDEDDHEFDDETCMIYVNGENEDDTPLGRLMHDFKCTNPDDMYYDLLRERVKYFKEDKRGVEEMCKIWDDIKKEGKEEGKIEGKREGLKEGIHVGKIGTYKQLYDDGVLTKEQFEFYIQNIQIPITTLAV